MSEQATYVTRAAIVILPDTYEHQILGGETVYEPESEYTATGLIAPSGLPLYRVVNKVPLGFDLTWRSRKL